MTLATLLFAALLPAVPPDAPNAVSRLSDAPIAPPTVSQRIVTRVVQVTGGEAAGLAVGVGAGIGSLVPAYVLTEVDSGNVAGGFLVASMGAGYCVGASWAICKAAREIEGTSGPMLETGLGVGAGLVLAGAVVGTGLVPAKGEAIAAVALLPPMTGILVYEMTKRGPAVRRPDGEIPEQAFAVAAFGVAAAGYAVMRANPVSEIHPAGRSRVILPLMQVRW